MITNLDNDLGSVAVTLAKCIQDALVHLQDNATYEFIIENKALKSDKELRSDIFQWIVKYRKQIGDDIVDFLRAKSKESKADLFGYFYLLYKLRKTPIKIRPICFDCTSTPHALGLWVNEMLQPIAQQEEAHFKDSFALKDILNKVTLPSGKQYSLFTFDTVSRYTDIDTLYCIKRISTYLEIENTQARLPHYHYEALTTVFTLVTKNNIMSFEDTFIQHLTGIAMGISPVPSIANLYVTIYESEHIV